MQAFIGVGVAYLRSIIHRRRGIVVAIQNIQRKMTKQTTSSLILELQQAISDTTNQVNGRRTCTRILNQWKKEILPNLSNGECLQLLLCVGDDITDIICDDDKNDSCSSMSPTVQTLLSLINNDDDVSTEGHRESSVDILRLLFQQGFGNSSTDNDGILQTTLTNLFYQCSQTFQRRMSKCQLVSSTSESSKFRSSTATSDPLESSEHIRLLLVELMLDLGGYCLASISTNTTTNNSNIDSIESNNKKILNASSIICQTLAKFTINDPYPEVQRAACNLVEVLSKLCPLAVRMNAVSLLVSLTGRVDDTCGASNQLSTDTSMISKKCLFRHRHAKTRCKGVDASSAIVTCCPRGNSSSSSIAQTSTNVPEHLSNYGSHSTTMEQILNDTLLPGWEKLLKIDSSSSVQIAVLKALGNVASKLDWSYNLSADNEHTLKESTMDLTSIVEAHMLTLLLMCLSSGNVDQVRKLAVQQLTSVQSSSDGSDQDKLSWDILGAYFQPMVERILASCSTSWTSCQSRVRSLGALQVILSIAIPLMDKSEPSFDLMNSIIDTLSENILSEEKEVLEAALTCCRIFGAIALEVISSMQSRSEESTTLVKTDSDSSDESTTTIQSSPRQMTSILLMLDSMMKGSLFTEDSALILNEIDSTLDVSTPDWFYTSTKSATTISSLLCHTTTINNVATNSSLAWALLDACKSFVQCTEQLHDKLELTKDSIMNVLISITHLLSCPEQYGLTSTATNILDVFSSTVMGQNEDDEGLTLLDVHFRTILPKIIAEHEFPWKQSDPSFLAMDALLRHCKGSTVGNNFGLVVPFFISHLSNIPKKNEEINEESNSSQVLIMGESATTKDDDLTEEYSLRISLMALLQTILSEQSFSQTERGSHLQQKGEFSAVSSALAAQFTTDALLSIVIPNLVWKAGAMASVLRKIAVATLYSLLRHHCNRDGCTGMLRPEMISHLIPVLSSNVEDSESTTRELSCVCLSMVLGQVSDEIFSQICKTNKRVFNSLCPRLLEALDDSHNPVRVAACSALEAFIKLASNSQSSFDLELATLENILSSLLIQLDDPDKDIQESVFNTLSVLVELHTCDANANKEVVLMMTRLVSTALQSHRDKSYCSKLLDKVEELGSS